MAAVRSTSSLSGGTRSNSSLTAPSGIQNGDVLLLLLSIGAGSGGVTATGPTGFSVLTGLPVLYTWSGLDSYTVRMYAWYKIASSESGNYATTHSSAYSQGFMYAISGGAASPINPNPTTGAYLGSAFPQDGTVLVAPSITPVVNDSLVVWFGGTWDNFGNATPPSGTTPTFTERFNPPADVFYVADGVLATAGATGDKSVTSGQAADRPQGRGMICIEAAAGAAPASLIFRPRNMMPHLAL